MSEQTASEVSEELSAWLEENWDPEITVAEWWARLFHNLHQWSL